MEPHRIVRVDDDDRIERLEALHIDQERRIAALEKWQAFVLGACAAVGALVGIGLTVLSLLPK